MCFFFKQKTAYEMRISDWSSDVCSSDLSGLKFENSALAYQAATDTLGIVMAQRAFVEDDLRTGRLVAPLPLRVSMPSAYYLAYPRSRRTAPVIRAFEEWIVQQTAEMEEAVGRSEARRGGEVCVGTCRSRGSP